MERTTKRVFCLLLCMIMMLGLCADAFAYSAYTTVYCQDSWEELTIRKQYYVAGTATLCGTDWHPCDPDNAMTKRDNTIWYKTYKNVAPGTYAFRVTDGTWNNSWYDSVPGTDYGGDNYVLVIDDYSDVTVLFESTSERVITEVIPHPTDNPTDPTEPEYSLPNYGTTRLYCQAPSHWDRCWVYWWNNHYPVSWPGIEMTQAPNGIWYYDVPSDATNVIFNNYDYGYQTADLDMPTDDKTTYLYEDAVWVNPYYDPVPQGPFYVAGCPELCGSSWHPDDPNNQMVQLDDTTWSKTYDMVPPGDYELKVAAGTWDNCWGGNGGDFDNFKFSVLNTCSVTVIFSLDDNIGTITLKGDGVVGSGGSSDCTHSFTNYIYNLDAKCGVDGTETATCDRCRETHTQSAPGTALNHTFEDGICVHCGQKEGTPLPGDLTEDNKLDIGDVAKLYALIQSSDPMVDAQLLSCADITGDGKLNVGDVARLYAHIRGTNLLA